MSSVDLPQKNNSQPGGNLEKIKEEVRKAAEVLEKHGKLPKGEGVDKLFEERGKQAEEKEEKKRGEKSKGNNLEKLLSEVDKLDANTVAKLIENGASDRDIIYLLKENPEKLNEFFKFNGSSYYLSEESFEEENDPQKYKWRTKSLMGKTFTGDTQKNMFLKYIPKELERYRQLLEAFGSADEMFKAIDSLDEGEITKSTRVLKPRLLELAKSGEYKKTEKQDNKSESKENVPLFESGDLVMWFKPDLKANRWEKPKRVKRVKIDDGSVDLFIEGEDVKFPVKTDSGDVQFKIIEKAGEQEEGRPEDETEPVADSDEFISEEEYKKFVDEGLVSGSVVNHIAEKVKNRQSLTEKEQAIFTDKTSEINKKLEGLAENEKVKPEKEDGKESANESIDDEVKEKFQEQFNISEYDLRSIPGFVALSAGQQRLVYKNFSKVTLGRIEEQGVSDYRDDVAGSGRFSRMWKGFFSTYYKKKEQSLAGEEILNKGIDLHRGAISDIVKQTRISGLDLDESGALKFISHEEFLQIADENIPEEVELMSRLNSAAEEFSQVSDEWRYADTFTQAKDSIKKLFGREVDDYHEKLRTYKKALSDCVDFVAEKHGQEGVRRLMEIDKKVRFTQFFESGSDIDYEEALQNIKDEPKWWRIADNVGMEKGAYVALGYIGRTASYGMLTVAAVPVAIASAMGIGGVRARRQALEQLNEEAKLRRGGADASLSRSTERFMDWGTIEELENINSWSEPKEILKKRRQEQNKTDVINTVSAESLSEKLQQQLEKINSPSTSEEERNNSLEALRRRVRYTRIKMEGGEYQEGSEDGEGGGKTHEFSGGLIDYGDAYHRTGHRYELLSTLGEAEATLAVSDPDIRGDIDNRLDRYLNYKNDKVKKYVHKKTWRGTILAGGFAGIGSWLAGHWSADEVSQVEVASPETDSGQTGDTTLDAEGDSTKVAMEQSDLSEVPKPPLGTQDFIIDEKGEGMIHAIADGLEDKYDISHEKAMEIGNKLFVKGEKLQGDDELYNLVGKGTTFNLDFADLTEADLENLSADELVEKIDFDNETGFTAGESGIKGLELPEDKGSPDNSSYGQYSESGSMAELREMSIYPKDVKLSSGQIEGFFNALGQDNYSYQEIAQEIPEGLREEFLQRMENAVPGDIGKPYFAGLYEFEELFHFFADHADALGEDGREFLTEDTVGDFVNFWEELGQTMGGLSGEEQQLFDQIYEHIDVVESYEPVELQDIGEQGIEIEESGAVEAAADSSAESAEAQTEATQTTSETVEAPEQSATLTESEMEILRGNEDLTTSVNKSIDGLRSSIPPGASGTYKDISINALSDLNEFMDNYSGKDMVTAVERMAEKKPDLLLTLDQVVNSGSEEIAPDSALGRLSRLISDTIQQVEDDGSLSQAMRDKISIDKAHLDALTSTEVTPEAMGEMGKEMEGLNSELHQYADKTNEKVVTKEGLERFDDMLKQMGRISNRVDADEGSRFFGNVRDVLDDVLDKF